MSEDPIIDENFEEEDTSSDDRVVEPWDPQKIRITTKHFSLRDVVNQIDDEEIDLSPDFQREYVWKTRQKTRLVESILLGIPLPAFYFNQSESGSYQVVDGVQRLSTISLFMNNLHTLSSNDLEYLDDLDGKKYKDLEPSSLRRFRSTQIIVHVIEPQTPEDIKFDIFNRVNTLGSPLSAQEIRHAMSKKRSRNFLQSLVENESFDLATEHHFWSKKGGVNSRHSRRMSDRELALRFCAFRNFSMDQYKKQPSLDAFLVSFLKNVDDDSSDEFVGTAELKQLHSDFQNAMINAGALLGNAAFRRWPLEVTRRGPINRAVFESQSVALADYALSELAPFKGEIAHRFREAFEDPEYSRAVTVSTGTATRVALRIDKTKAILREIIG